MEAIFQTFCSLEEEMGLHSISNQCFHNIFASLFLQNFICIPYTVSHLSFCAFVDFQYRCVLYYDPTIGCHTQEFAIFAAIAYCVLAIFIIYPTILFILYPTRLFRKCVLCCGFRRWHAVHVCGIFSGTVQGWNQWYS